MSVGTQLYPGGFRPFRAPRSTKTALAALGAACSLAPAGQRLSPSLLAEAPSALPAPKAAQEHVSRSPVLRTAKLAAILGPLARAALGPNAPIATGPNAGDAEPPLGQPGGGSLSQPPLGLAGAGDPAAAQAQMQGFLPPAPTAGSTTQPQGPPGQQSPTQAPIQHYGPLSASGTVNGNAGFGVANSPTPAKAAAAEQLLGLVAGPAIGAGLGLGDNELYHGVQRLLGYELTPDERSRNHWYAAGLGGFAGLRAGLRSANREAGTPQKTMQQLLEEHRQRGADTSRRHGTPCDRTTTSCTTGRTQPRQRRWRRSPPGTTAT